MALRIQSEPDMTWWMSDTQICERTSPVCIHLTFPFHVAAYVSKWKFHNFKGHYGVLINQFTDVAIWRVMKYGKISANNSYSIQWKFCKSTVTYGPKFYLTILRKTRGLLTLHNDFSSKSQRVYPDMGKSNFSIPTKRANSSSFE